MSSYRVECADDELRHVFIAIGHALENGQEHDNIETAVKTLEVLQRRRIEPGECFQIGMGVTLTGRIAYLEIHRDD